MMVWTLDSSDIGWERGVQRPGYFQNVVLMWFNVGIPKLINERNLISFPILDVPAGEMIVKFNIIRRSPKLRSTVV